MRFQYKVYIKIRNCGKQRIRKLCIVGEKGEKISPLFSFPKCTIMSRCGYFDNLDLVQV